MVFINVIFDRDVLSFKEVVIDPMERERLLSVTTCKGNKVFHFWIIV